MMCKRVVLTILLIAYVGVSVVVPYAMKSHASCSRGFFWEDHLLFMGLLGGTKIVELVIIAKDPTLMGCQSLIAFILTFAPSVVGYADAYTDAMSATIASACTDSLAHKL